MIRRLPILTLWILVLAAWGYARFDGGFHPWFLFYTALAIACLESYIYLLGIRFAHISRELSDTRLHAGNTIDVTIRIAMPFWVKVPYIVIEDCIPVSLRSAFYDQKQVVFPGLSRHVQITYQIHDLKRGLHTFSKIQCETGDIFGLIRKSKWVRMDHQIIVYPKVVPVRGWRDQQRFIGMGLGAAVRNQSNDGTQVYGVREYNWGDRLSRIHWPATARTNVLKSKEFEATVDENVILLFNRSAAKKGVHAEKCFELAVTATASLSKHVLERDLTVQLVSLGSERNQFVITRTNDGMLAVMEHLAKVKQDGTKAFHEWIQFELDRIQKGQLLVIITPVMDDSMLNLIQQIQRRGVQVECFWCDAERQERTEPLSHTAPVTYTGFKLYSIRSEKDLMDLQREEHHRALVR